MAELSPAAQAIIDAIGIPLGSSLYPVAAGFSAAALRAAADQVVPANGSRRTQEIRAELLAIVTELENHQ